MRLTKLETIVSHPRHDSGETEKEFLRLTQLEQANRAVQNSKSDWSKKFWTNNLMILQRRGT